MTPNRNKTLVGLPLPPQLEEDPFPLSRRISYTRLSQMLPPPVDEAERWYAEELAKRARGKNR